MPKDFVVVGGGKGKIAVDMVEGRSIDFFVVHRKERTREGGRG